MTWDEKFIGLSFTVAGWSKDQRRQVGAVIVSANNIILSTGYNGLPMQVDESIPERHTRPLKYKYTEHAERNAIYFAARNGVKIEGAKMYCTWHPCADCARAIIQSGITEIITKNSYDYNDPGWADDFVIAKKMLFEAGVKLTIL